MAAILVLLLLLKVGRYIFLTIFVLASVIAHDC